MRLLSEEHVPATQDITITTLHMHNVIRATLPVIPVQMQGQITALGATWELHCPQGRVPAQVSTSAVTLLFVRPVTSPVLHAQPEALPTVIPAMPIPTQLLLPLPAPVYLNSTPGQVVRIAWLVVLSAATASLGQPRVARVVVPMRP